MLLPQGDLLWCAIRRSALAVCSWGPWISIVRTLTSSSDVVYILWASRRWGAMECRPCSSRAWVWIPAPTLAHRGNTEKIQASLDLTPLFCKMGMNYTHFMQLLGQSSELVHVMYFEEQPAHNIHLRSSGRNKYWKSLGISGDRAALVFCSVCHTTCPWDTVGSKKNTW